MSFAASRGARRAVGSAASAASAGTVASAATLLAQPSAHAHTAAARTLFSGPVQQQLPQQLQQLQLLQQQQQQRGFASYASGSGAGSGIGPGYPVIGAGKGHVEFDNQNKVTADGSFMLLAAALSNTRVSGQTQEQKSQSLSREAFAQALAAASAATGSQSAEEAARDAAAEAAAEALLQQWRDGETLSLKTAAAAGARRRQDLEQDQDQDQDQEQEPEEPLDDGGFVTSNAFDDIFAELAEHNQRILDLRHSLMHQRSVRQVRSTVMTL